MNSHSKLCSRNACMLYLIVPPRHWKIMRSRVLAKAGNPSTGNRQQMITWSQDTIDVCLKYSLLSPPYLVVVAKHLRAHSKLFQRLCIIDSYLRINGNVAVTHNLFAKCSWQSIRGLPVLVPGRILTILAICRRSTVRWYMSLNAWNLNDSTLWDDVCCDGLRCSDVIWALQHSSLPNDTQH